MTKTEGRYRLPCFIQTPQLGGPARTSQHARRTERTKPHVVRAKWSARASVQSTHTGFLRATTYHPTGTLRPRHRNAPHPWPTVVASIQVGCRAVTPVRNASKALIRRCRWPSKLSHRATDSLSRTVASIALPRTSVRVMIG